MKNKFEFLKDILNKSNNETVIINRGEFLDSSVLIIITKINDEYNVIFEKRAKEIRQSGEICFPGGIKSKEDQNYLDTALRECEEEIGINRKNIDILGGLGTFIVGGKVIIDVFIGFCDYENIKNCILNYDEVEKIITVPVKFFMENKPKDYKIKTINFARNLDKNGAEEVYFPAKELGLPENYHNSWDGVLNKVVLYKYKDEYIWGITGKIIEKFIEIVAKNINI